MKQVKKTHKVRRFGTRLLIAVAIITALAVPVMAVSGGWFEDWLAVTKDYQDSLIFHWEEAEEKGNENWDVSGWFIEMWGEGATATGMTLVCNEFSNNAHGATLTTNEGYWIEKWNGTDYEKMEAQVPEGETIEIQPKTMTNWTVDWSDTYGSLESGYYRIAKTFTCGEETAVIYGTFRVFTEDMEPYIRKCNDSLAELLASDSWHMTWTDYRIYDSPGEFNLERTEMEIWRSGEDYLFMDTGYALDGSVAFRGGSMFREGFGYTNIRWAGDTVESEIVDWQNASYLDHSNFDLWPGGMNIWEDIVGQVCDNGNQIIVIEYNAPIGGGQSDMTKEEILAQAPYAFHDYTEKTFTFDENAELCRIEETVQTGVDVPDSEKVLHRVLEIHDTPAEETAKVIKSQDVSKVKTFSYSQDYDLYKNMGKAEGFVNADAITLNSASNAIDRAQKEIDPKKDPGYRDGARYNCAQAFYDMEMKIWKVVFWDSQDDNFSVIVYLDNDGITKLIVYP